MKKDIYNLSKSGAVLFIISIFFIVHTSYSQCTNPIPTGSSSQTFCVIDGKTVGDLNASGGTITWFDTPVGGNPLLNSAHLFNNSVYYADDTSGGGCSTSRLEVTVTLHGDIPEDVFVFVGKCASTNPTIGDLSATGTSIEWFAESIGGTSLSDLEPLVDGETYWVQQTENTCTSERFPTTITILDPDPPVVDALQTFCADTNPTVADLNGVGNNILWYDTNSSLTPIDPLTPLTDGKDYWGAQSSNSFPCESTVRAQTTAIIDQPPVAGVDGSYSACELNFGTPNLFDSLGGADTTGVWTGPSNLTNGYLGTFDPVINTVGVYTYTVTSSEGACSDAVASVTVAMTVIPPPTDSDITAIFCEIDGATVADLSSDPNITWYDAIDGITPIDPTTVLANGQVYWSSLGDPVSGCESASRLEVTVAITQIPPPDISNITTVFCQIDGATVADLSSDPNILWYDTFIGTTPVDPTVVLANGQIYWSTLTEPASGCESASRLEATITITQIPPPDISTITVIFCEIDGATVADISSDPNILWYDTIDGTTVVDPSTVLANGQVYWSTLTDPTSGCESAGRLEATITITQIPPPTDTIVTSVFCEIDGATVADLSADTTILWYDVVDGTTPVTTSTPLADGQIYWSSLTDPTSGCESASRLEVTVAITQIPPPTSSDVTTTFCDTLNATIADLSADPNILWYDAANSTTSLATSTPLVNGQKYWSTLTDPTSTCESASRLEIEAVIITPPLPPTAAANQNYCILSNATIAELSVNGTNVLWYATNSDTTPLSTDLVLVGGDSYYATQSPNGIAGCESLTRTMVSVTLLDPAPPVIDNNSQSFCASDNPTISDISITANNAVWYDSNGNPLNPDSPLVDGDFLAADIDPTSGCESSVRATVSITLIDPGTPTIVSLGNEFCKIDQPTVSELNDNVSPVNGGDITWYDAFPNGNEVFLSEDLEEGTTYYAVEIDNTNCSSATPLAVTVTLESCSQYDIEVYDGFSPNGDGRNDTFTITYLKDLYPNYDVEFFNRWGATVYKTNANKPDWDGRLNGNGELVPAGVYYVVINFNEPDKKPIQKRLYLSR